MRVGLIGAGNMARAIARGWGDPVLCSDGGSGRAQALADELGGEAFDSNVEVAERADLVVLCHKPAQLQTVADEIRGKLSAVASVLGGVDTGNLQTAYWGASVFRLIPSTTVEVRQGIVCYSPARDVDPAIEAEVVALFERLGQVVTVPERMMGAATSITSVGPAYQALLAEAQVDAAIRHGLPAPIASRFVADTMSGTAALLAARNYDTLAVRREVASPGGTTARGLAALERADIRGAFHDAIDAVMSREGGR